MAQAQVLANADLVAIITTFVSGDVRELQKLKRLNRVRDALLLAGSATIRLRLHLTALYA